jgi:hypothetical protein
MVHNTQNYWAFQLCPSSCIVETRKHVSETGYGPSPAIEVSYFSGTHLSWYLPPPPLTWIRKQLQFPKRSVFQFLQYRTIGKGQKPNNSRFRLGLKNTRRNESLRVTSGSILKFFNHGITCAPRRLVALIIYLPGDYLTMLPVAQTLQRRMVGLLVNTAQERFWQ